MSVEARRAWVTQSRAPKGTVFDIGKELAWLAQRRTNLVWATNLELAAACRCSERQVQRALRWLERAGEIIPQTPLPGRRRVFLVTPGTPNQEPLFTLPEGDIAKSPPKATSDVTPKGGRQGDMGGLEGDIHARAGKEVRKTINDLPPNPRKRGNATPDLLGSFKQPVLTCGAPVPPKPRRRRERDALHAALLDACPNGKTDKRAIGEWQALAQTLRERIGEETWQIWLGSAHAHRIDSGTLVVATSAETLEWVHGRFGAVIAQASKRPVALVACAELGGAR